MGQVCLHGTSSIVYHDVCVCVCGIMKFLGNNRERKHAERPGPLLSFGFLFHFQSGPGAADIVRLAVVSACSPLNCKTRVPWLYTAHFTHYFHIAQITAIQPRSFVSAEKARGGREGDKTLCCPAQKPVNQNAMFAQRHSSVGLWGNYLLGLEWAEIERG